MQLEAGVSPETGRASGAEAAARLVQRSSRGIVIVRRVVRLLKRIGVMVIVQVLPAQLVQRSSRGIAALKANVLGQPATGAKQEIVLMDIVQTRSAQAAT